MGRAVERSSLTDQTWGPGVLQRMFAAHRGAARRDDTACGLCFSGKRPPGGQRRCESVARVWFRRLIGTHAGDRLPFVWRSIIANAAKALRLLPSRSADLPRMDHS